MNGEVLRRRDVLKLFGSAAAVTLLVTACGGGAPAPTAAPQQAASGGAAPAASPTAAAQQAAAPAGTPTPAPQTGGAAGPTPTPNPLASVPIKSGKPVIEWWFGWGGMTGIHALSDVARVFNESHDDFQVKPLQVDSITQKLLAAIAGGTAPSVETGNINFAEFWVKGAAQPLDDYIKSSKTINLDDFFEANLKAGQWKGKTYGVPAVECFLRWALCFNQTFLDKANIKPDQLPADFDSLYQFAKETTVVESSGAIKTLGFDPLDAMGGSFGDGDPFYWPAAYNFKYFDEASGRYNFNNDQMVEAMAMIQKFYDIVGADKIAGFHKSYGTWTESPTAMFPSGVEGANINGYWAPGELAKSAPDKKFVYGWVPTAQKGVKLQSTGGHYGMLPKGGPNPDLGFKFIEFLTTKPALDAIFNGTGWLGARKSYLKDVDVSKYPGLDFFIKSADAATVMWQVLVDPIQSFVSDQWSKLQESVNYHKITPKEAAAQLQQAAETEMKNQFPNGV
jgi:multiple sugar transport system substrate-binding protein